MAMVNTCSPTPELEEQILRPYSSLAALSFALAPAMIVCSHFGSLLLLSTGITAGAFVWVAALYLTRTLATTAFYHRLLTHRAYRAPRFVLWVGCLVAASSAQLGPSCWKAHHLAHHRCTDCQGDPHSPTLGGAGLQSFLWSQMGWVLSPAIFPERLPADVEADPVLRVIDRLHFLPVLVLGALSYWYGGWLFLGAFCLSNTLQFHATATVNSLSHLFGHRPFLTDDDSRNNSFVALLNLGEGWHNLHHAFPLSCRHGFTVSSGRVQRLPDPTFSFIRLLSFFGLASDLKIPSDAMLLSKSSSSSREMIPSSSPV